MCILSLNRTLVHVTLMSPLSLLQLPTVSLFFFSLQLINMGDCLDYISFGVSVVQLLEATALGRCHGDI